MVPAFRDPHAGVGLLQHDTRLLGTKVFVSSLQMQNAGLHLVADTMARMVRPSPLFSQTRHAKLLITALQLIARSAADFVLATQ